VKTVFLYMICMSLHDYYRNAALSIRAEIEEMEADRLIHTERSEIVEYFLQKYKLPILEKDDSRDIQVERGKGYQSTIPVRVHYPLKPANRIIETARSRPSVWTYSGGINVSFDRTTCSFTGDTEISLSSPERGKSPQDVIDRIELNIQQINNDINAGNSGVARTASETYDQFRKIREEEATAFDRWVEKTPVKVIRKTDSKAIPFEIQIKPTIEPILPDPKKEKEPFLTRESLNSVIELIKNAGLAFERTPKAFSKLEEEDIRDVLLSTLNAVFRGEATGETFSKSGKTDIYIRFSAKDLLICECKFWDGEKSYTKALEQLFSYLTWRESYGILITLSKRSSFSEVVTKAMDVTSVHPTIISGSIKKISDGYFTTIHSFPDDKAKHIEIHHMLFNLQIS
jgi:hypothetical protein